MQSFAHSGRRRDCRPLKGTGDGGRAAGHLKSCVDVLQVLAHGAFGHVQPPCDLAVGETLSDEAQDLPVPRGQRRDATAARFRLCVRLLQVRAQQGEQGAVAFGEIPARAPGRTSAAPCAPVRPEGTA